MRTNSTGCYWRQQCIVPKKKKKNPLSMKVIQFESVNSSSCRFSKMFSILKTSIHTHTRYLPSAPQTPTAASWQNPTGGQGEKHSFLKQLYLTRHSRCQWRTNGVHSCKSSLREPAAGWELLAGRCFSGQGDRIGLSAGVPRDHRGFAITEGPVMALSEQRNQKCWCNEESVPLIRF